MRLPSFVSLVATLSLVAPAMALNESTYQQVALDSLRLAPPTLGHIADRHREQLIRGALSPIASEGGAEHLAAPRGIVEKRVAEQADRIVVLINERAPFDKVVYELGILSHYVADLNNPLNTAAGDPRYEKIRKDFETYIARKTDKFTLTFTGHAPSPLDQRNVTGFATDVADRSAKLGPYLMNSYFPGGQMVSSRTFDDRHTAFGVASISYQNAVGDCARLYLYIWKQVNGDLRGTPFYGDNKRGRAAASTRNGTFRW